MQYTYIFKKSGLLRFCVTALEVLKRAHLLKAEAALECAKPPQSATKQDPDNTYTTVGAKYKTVLPVCEAQGGLGSDGSAGDGRARRCYWRGWLYFCLS